ncbi:fas apoptotic inhibitory molecule 3 isoform X2 [Trichosurus vulpecula]|uniref:fas apoptotic inhibitory molecule 3 isoform X2 n=1 Tax=Trichosurus vulpecula TaxID=9337 RepID=UPI00186B187B|nr:fas apoptotic inhibitory molecule 3 isoform X2 [Trichosurus vulpecula]
MDVFLRILFFLPISKALKPLGETTLSGELGGYIDIECPLKDPLQSYYLCRENGPRQCSIVVSSTSFVGPDYKGRVSLKLLPEENVFLVELRKLKEEDNGSYACGMGKKIDRWKTWKVILTVMPVSKALKPLGETTLSGELGGYIDIECPLKDPLQSYYLCREIGPRQCSIVVSSTSFVGPDYKGRVSLKLLPEENVFLVELRKLKEEDNGSYACGMGKKTDRRKTWKVILTVMPATSTSAPRIQPQQTQPPLDPSPTSRQRTTLAAAVASQTSRSPVASKTLHLSRLLRPSTVSYSHHTRLRGESASYFGSSVKKDGGFHILIPATLGIILMMLLGMVLGRSLQKRRALSRRLDRLTMRMSALEASQRAHSHLHRSHQRRLHRPVSNRFRSQHNIYSACPRQVQRADQNGEQMPASGPRIAEPSTPTQVSKTVQLQAPVPVKNEYMSTYRLCLPEPEDSDSHDYINVSCLTQMPDCPPGLGFHANKACH